MADVIILKDDEVAYQRLNELINEDHRFGLDETYQISCQIASLSEIHERIARGERFVALYSYKYASSGIRTVRALSHVESGHHVYCLVPEAFGDLSFIFKVNDQPLLSRSGKIIWAVRQLHADDFVPIDSFFDRHRGLV